MSASDPVDIFRLEAQELLEQIEQGLLDLSETPGDQDLVAAVFRALHTLKGSGAMFGFDALAAFTHHCETAFDRVRKGAAKATPDLVAAVLNAMDHMRALAEERAGDAGVGEALLAELERVVAAAAAEPIDAAAPSPLPSASSPVTWRIAFTLAQDVLINGVRPLPMLDELRELGACQVRALTDAIPPLEVIDPTRCHLGWEVMLTTDKPRAAIEDVFMFVMDDMNLDIQDVSGAVESPGVFPGARGPDFETAPSQPEAMGIAPHGASEDAHAQTDRDAAGADAKAGRTDASVRVPAHRLDELMDRVGELVIAQSRLKEITSASQDMSLRSVSEEIGLLASELRDSMMSVRMVPVAQLFSRFRRLIHDLARDTGSGTLDLEAPTSSAASSATTGYQNIALSSQSHDIDMNMQNAGTNIIAGELYAPNNNIDFHGGGSTIYSYPTTPSSGCFSALSGAGLFGSVDVSSGVTLHMSPCTAGPTMGVATLNQ